MKQTLIRLNVGMSEELGTVPVADYAIERVPPISAFHRILQDVFPYMVSDLTEFLQHPEAEAVRAPPVMQRAMGAIEDAPAGEGFTYCMI